MLQAGVGKQILIINLLNEEGEKGRKGCIISDQGI